MTQQLRLWKQSAPWFDASADLTNKTGFFSSFQFSQAAKMTFMKAIHDHGLSWAQRTLAVV